MTTEVGNIPLAVCGQNNGDKGVVEMLKETDKFLPTVKLKQTNNVL